MLIVSGEQPTCFVTSLPLSLGRLDRRALVTNLSFLGLDFAGGSDRGQQKDGNAGGTRPNEKRACDAGGLGEKSDGRTCRAQRDIREGYEISNSMTAMRRWNSRVARTPIAGKISENPAPVRAAPEFRRRQREVCSTGHRLPPSSR
jgi:hypothetical protein